MLKLFVIIGSLAFFFSCTPHNETTNQEGLTIPSYLIDNSAVVSLQSCEDLFDLRVIELDEEASVLVGGAVRDFIPFADKVVLVDRHASRLTAVDFDGDILWQLKSQNTPLNSFSSIFTARLNPFNKLIEVFDDNSFSVYSFDESGKFVSKRKEVTSLLDRVAFSDVEVVYDLNFFPKAYLDPDGTAYDFARSSDGLNIVKFKKNGSFDPDDSAYVTFDNFNLVGDDIYHHKNFFDTINRVNIDAVEPIYTIKCKQGESAQEIMTNLGLNDKVSYIMKESVPFVIQSVPIEYKVYSTYRKGRRKGIHVIDERSVELVNAFYLRHEEHIFPAPIIYRDGYFFSMLFDSQLSEIKELKSNPEFPESFSADQVSSFSPDSDLEKLTLFIFTPK